MKQNKTNKPQARPTQDREAVRVLAIELGAREAARRVGINESTVLSWAKRYDWKLPKRKGGATIKSATAITMQSKPGDALIAVHEDYEGVTKTGLKRTLAKAVKALAEKDALPVESIAQFKDACLAGAKLFGWDGKPETQINVGIGVGIVCTEEQRKRWIGLREKLTGALPPTAVESRNVETKKIEPQCNDATPDGKPSSLWSVPAGTKATSDDSPVKRAWLEYEAQEPEGQAGPAGN
jgi:hypothetical protein